MKTVIAFLSLLILLANVGIASSSELPLCKDDIDIVSRHIKSKEKVVSDTYVSLNTTEDDDFRKYAFGDVNGDGISDVVVMYMLEEGNSWKSYLAVFEKPSMKFIADAYIGGKGYRVATINQVANNAIELDVQLYSPYDAMCCPSVNGTVDYYLQDGSLIEGRLLVDCTGWKPPER